MQFLCPDIPRENLLRIKKFALKSSLSSSLGKVAALFALLAYIHI